MSYHRLAQQASLFTAGRKFLYHFLLFSGVIILVSGCLGPKKINKWVGRHYDGAIPPAPGKTNESITITSSLAPADDRISNTEKKTSHFLPLLFYWQWDYKNTCVLSPKIAINNFTATVGSYAGRKGLKQKLHGQRLQLSVDQAPNTFAIDDKGHMIWVIIYAFGWDNLTVQPERTDLVVSYKLLQQDGTQVKKGIITIPDSDKGIELKMFQSLKKKTGQYLDQYDAQMTAMSKAVVDKLLTEL